MPNPDLPTYVTGDPMPAADMNTLVTSVQGANADIVTLQGTSTSQGDDITALQTDVDSILAVKEYTVLLTDNSCALAATVLKNTTGLTFTPNDNACGWYYLAVTGGTLDLAKTVCFMSPADFPDTVFYVQLSTNEVNIDVKTFAGTRIGDRLNNASLQIKIYP